MTVLLPGLLPLTVVAFVWARWLVQRKGDRAGVWRWVPWGVVSVTAASALGTTAMLVQVFRAVDSASADIKQTMLASGISGATGITGAGFVAVTLVLVALGIETVRERASTKGPRR